METRAKVRVTVDKTDLKAFQEGVTALRAAAHQWTVLKNFVEADRLSAHAQRLSDLVKRVLKMKYR